MAAAFDTLAYARRLRQAGFSEEQAEVQAEALAAVINETLVTKQDLRDLATKQDIRELKQELNELGRGTKQDVQELRQEVKELGRVTKQDIREVEYRLTVRLGTMLTVAVGALAALVKLL